jgi:hypothetical protein
LTTSCSARSADLQPRLRYHTRLRVTYHNFPPRRLQRRATNRYHAKISSLGIIKTLSAGWIGIRIVMADIKVVIAGSLDSGIIRLGLEIHGSGGHTTDLTHGESAGHIHSCWLIRRMRNADIRSQRSSIQNEELGCIQLASNLGTTLVDGAECCRLCFPLLKAFFFLRLPDTAAACTSHNLAGMHTHALLAARDVQAWIETEGVMYPSGHQRDLSDAAPGYPSQSRILTTRISQRCHLNPTKPPEYTLQHKHHSTRR